MTMLKFITTYCLTIFVSSAFAQSADTFKISGTVVSTNSGNAIAGGTIMITRTRGTIADSLGHFTIGELKRGQHKLSFSALGYDNKDTTVTIVNSNINNLIFSVHTDCYSFPEVNSEMALKDIKEGKPKLLLAGGIAPVVYTTDNDFSNKYKVSFYDYGCSPARQECMLAYNTTIFNYLDKTYGTKWRKKVRQDVIGLKDK